MQLTGLHHVTAVTSRASANLDFYTQALGMRLVKKTVNQDDVSAYHLFYGDALGSAGTEMTFFDWSMAGPNRPGVGSISETGFRVENDAALAWWSERFDALGIAHQPIQKIAGRSVLRFTDPEGQALRLATDNGAPGGTPWDRSPVPVDKGIRGLDGVTLTVARLAPTQRTLVDTLGFRLAESYQTPAGHLATVFEVGSGGAGTEVHVIEKPGTVPTRQGAGGVHHVAFRTPNREEQLAWHNRIADSGLYVTEQIDRYYFSSIYFREPNGILFEIATDGPGFATDEPLDHLGESLALPPFLEGRRARIEAGLKPLDTKNAS